MYTDTDKENLISLMEKESTQFLYLKSKSNLHLNWDDGLIFLYFLHSVIGYDNRRKNMENNYEDLLSLVIAMREVGIKLIPDKCTGIRIQYSKLWNDPQELNIWRGYLGKHNKFIVDTFAELGKLFFQQ